MTMELSGRLKRLYAAMAEVEVKDLSKFPANPAGGFPDFSGGLSPEQVENLAWGIIQNVAHLRDHARKYARANGRNPEDVDRTVDNSSALQLVLDLADREKHGGGRRDGGFSGHNPRLGGLIRGMPLGVPGREPVHITVGASGMTVEPEGVLAVVLTAPIIADDGTTVGYLNEVLKEGLAAWEGLLVNWGIHAGAA
jgi:hypothetical protein